MQCRGCIRDEKEPGSEPRKPPVAQTGAFHFASCTAFLGGPNRRGSGFRGPGAARPKQVHTAWKYFGYISFLDSRSGCDGDIAPASKAIFVEESREQQEREYSKNEHQVHGCLRSSSFRDDHSGGVTASLRGRDGRRHGRATGSGRGAHAAVVPEPGEAKDPPRRWRAGGDGTGADSKPEPDPEPLDVGERRRRHSRKTLRRERVFAGCRVLRPVRFFERGGRGRATGHALFVCATGGGGSTPACNRVVLT